MGLPLIAHSNLRSALYKWKMLGVAQMRVLRQFNWTHMRQLHEWMEWSEMYNAFVLY
jgi:hypothetical protein